MNFLSKAATFVGVATLAISSFASPKIVTQCPSVGAIKAQGISMVVPIDVNLYVGLESSQYDTNTDWAFLIGPVESEDYDDAVGLTNEALGKISGAPLPEEEDGLTFCEYETGSQDTLAFAVAADFMVSTQKVQHLFHKK